MCFELNHSSNATHAGTAEQIFVMVAQIDIAARIASADLVPRTMQLMQVRPFGQKQFRATYCTPDYEIEFIPDTQMRNQNGGGQDINFHWDRALAGHLNGSTPN